jgi:hypothetical protein
MDACEAPANDTEARPYRARERARTASRRNADIQRRALNGIALVAEKALAKAP